MKTLLKALGVLVLAVAGIAAFAAGYLSVRKPAQRAASTETVERTPERLARGQYLVNNAADCAGCHSERDAAIFGLPIKEGRAAAGGFTWDAKIGFPGSITAPNLTSDPETGLGSWTDGEILRAMREGVRRDGTALFPIMPYPHLRNLSDEDAKSIVAYLRSMPPVKHVTPKRYLNFPLNFIVKFMPKPLEGPVAGPAPNDSVARGQYLAEIGGCHECHTPHMEKGELDETRAFAGGWEMIGPWGRVVSSNITPHPTTWLGQTTKEEFIARFKAFENFDARTAPKPAPGRNTVMPWLTAGGMTADDLGAIYDYLRAVPPIENHVNSFPDAK